MENLAGESKCYVVVLVRLQFFRISILILAVLQATARERISGRWGCLLEINASISNRGLLADRRRISIKSLACHMRAWAPISFYRTGTVWTAAQNLNRSSLFIGIQYIVPKIQKKHQNQQNIRIKGDEWERFQVKNSVFTKVVCDPYSSSRPGFWSRTFQPIN